jgi:hypothetical protein
MQTAKRSVEKQDYFCWFSKTEQVSSPKTLTSIFWERRGSLRTLQKRGTTS